MVRTAAPVVDLGETNIQQTLQELLDDFWGHSVDAAGAMVEAAGRFLLLQQESQQRMGNMLEVSQKPYCVKAQTILNTWLLTRLLCR